MKEGSKGAWKENKEFIVFLLTVLGSFFLLYNSIDSRFDRLESDINRLEDSLRTDISRLESRFEADINRLDDRIHSLILGVSTS